MRKAKKIIISILICLLAVESGLLFEEAYNYNKYKYSRLTLNGYIIAQVDNLINFSGMAR